MTRMTWGTFLPFLGILVISDSASGELLIRQKMFTSPDTYVMNKTATNDWWDVDMFCQVYSNSPAYVIDNSDVFWHVMSVYVDPCWARLVYMDQENPDPPQIRSYGHFGEGIDSLDEPMAVKVIAPMGVTYNFTPYYNIYVADRQNHRVVQLRYRWTTPDSGFIHVRYMDNQSWRPTDVDVSSSGLFENDLDDLVWVACKHDYIQAYRNLNGVRVVHYGGTGTGVGQFSDIRAIVCGKDFYNPFSGVYFANNDYIYVLDRGNNRIVKLKHNWDHTMQWQQEFVNELVYNFTDLEVDALGHIWATSDFGIIFKFTPDLQPLGSFGSTGTGPNQFDFPLSIASTGGYRGGGDMEICERWNSLSGIQHYAIATDVKDLHVNEWTNQGVCWNDIRFTLVDDSNVIVKIYNASGGLIRNLVSTPIPSGAIIVRWNGTNNSGQPVPQANYRAEIIATSRYLNDQGQPVNSVTKSVWFPLCGSSCSWLIGDSDGSGIIDISDAVYLMQYIFAGGPAPTPNAVGSGDCDCSHTVDISDMVYIINMIFAGGPPPGNPDNFPPDDCTCSDYN